MIRPNDSSDHEEFSSLLLIINQLKILVMIFPVFFKSNFQRKNQSLTMTEINLYLIKQFISF